jgi:23S rRNA pseudouridine1911/1915/1917 synthase
LILAARHDSAYQALRSEFQRHAIEKSYLAVVTGDVNKEFVVDTPIGQHAKSRRRMRVVAASPGAAGRRYTAWPASTRVEPIRRLGAVTLVRATTNTGVRHQIRVHLSSAGHPLVNDTLYAGAQTPLASGYLLHASRLRWRDPETGVIQEDECAMPCEWEGILAGLASEVVPSPQHASP